MITNLVAISAKSTSFGIDGELLFEGLFNVPYRFLRINLHANQTDCQVIDLSA